MIITRSWLQEWIDISDISNDDLCKTFNAIGLEVDRVDYADIGPKIVLGKVLECERHPDADKLNVCLVDVGTGTRQIVCGAKNVKKGIRVPVAMIGAVMPNGLRIKPVKLRGVESEGMICSSTEIGLPKLEDGIMVLDESLIDAPLGTPLNEEERINDTLIELELTANRGDCLSIFGVARDLGAAFSRSLKPRSHLQESDNSIGIGKMLALVHPNELPCMLRYSMVDLQGITLSKLMALRLAFLDVSKTTPLDNLLYYVTHATGVILKAYAYDAFVKETEAEQKAEIFIVKDSSALIHVQGKQIASTVGICQQSDSIVRSDSKQIILEASYIDPIYLAEAVHANKVATCDEYYRSSRGSEPDLALGMEQCLLHLEALSNSTLYGGFLALHSEFDPRVVSLDVATINSVIGNTLSKSETTNILSNLGFDVSKSKGEQLVIVVPLYRHDISNQQDVIEEVLRFIGIDNVASKALQFFEKRQLTTHYEAYAKRRFYRHKAASIGFFETVQFIFIDSNDVEMFEHPTMDTSLELVNPITSNFNTLRPKLQFGLIQVASQNMRNGYQRVNIFEIGSVFNSKREESLSVALLSCGNKEVDKLSNHGKSQEICFDDMVQKVSDLVGDFTMQAVESPRSYMNPYQCASLYKQGVYLGELYMLHPNSAKQYDLPITYICELDFSVLRYDSVVVQPYSKFQASFRDISVVIANSMEFETVKAVITQHSTSLIKRFYVVDTYSDESMNEQSSITIRFVLQSDEKTLDENDITSSVGQIVEALSSELGIALR